MLNKSSNAMASYCLIQGPLAVWKFHHAGESMYSRWSRFCMVRNLDSEELHELLGRVPLTRSIFSEKNAVRSREEGWFPKLLIELKISSEELWHMSGYDIFSGSSREKLLTPFLKYCPACLRYGFHSISYQHVRLGYCPYHQCLLETRCRKCGFEFSPTWNITGLNPFSCPRCGVLFIHTASRRDDAKDVELSTKKVEILRMSMRIEGGDGSINHPNLRVGEHGINKYKSVASLIRNFRRHIDWWDRRDTDVRGRTVVRRFNDMEGDRNSSVLWKEISESIYSVLSELSRRASFDGSSMSRAMHTVALKGSGVRFGINASLLHVAVAKTKYVYGVSAFSRLGVGDKIWDGDDSRRDCTFLNMFGMPVIDSIKASKEIAKYEVMGLFCAILMDACHLKDLWEVDWREVPNIEKYSPAWCYFTEMRVLVIRPRADWDLIDRLIKRYAAKFFPNGV